MNNDADKTLISGISGSNLTYLPGDTVDGAYQLTKLLGRGGMGAVFSCTHQQLNRDFALKLLSADNLSKEAWERFQQEAKVLARLNHPGIVGIYNMGIDKGQCPYYVMDILEGEALDSLIDRRGRLPVSEALSIFIQVADALNSAHAQGVIHRDIKPSNMMLLTPQSKSERNPTVKIVDFGIARVQKLDSSGQSQTKTGLIFGTPFYMSPEQCEGTKVDTRSDIYSFGCALFEALTGKPPFVGESAFKTFMMHQTERPPTLAESVPGETLFPEALEAALAKMLQKKPDARYQNMNQLKHDLERITTGKTIMPQGDTKYGMAMAAAQAARERVQEDDIEGGLSRGAKIGLIATAFTILSAAGIGTYLFINPPGKKAPHVVKEHIEFVTHVNPKDNALEKEAIEQERFMATGAMPYEDLEKYGTSQKEIDDVSHALHKVAKDEKLCNERLSNYLHNPKWMATKFKSGGVFHFPKDIIIGHISIDGKPSVKAMGDVSAGTGKSAVLSFLTPNKKHVQILDKFGPDDLTGVDVLFEDCGIAIDKLATWNRLEAVSFFNPLIKAMPNLTENYDESLMSDEDVGKVIKLRHLKSLGLCCPLDANQIKNLPTLKRIQTLKLKRIENIENLLRDLKYYNNLSEIWLVHQDTTYAHLAYLARMKNLERLVIRRSLLDRKSMMAFKDMPKLRYLQLDRNDWTAADRADLQKLIPHCKIVYEPVIEHTYWDMVP